MVPFQPTPSKKRDESKKYQLKIMIDFPLTNGVNKIMRNLRINVESLRYVCYFSGLWLDYFFFFSFTFF